MIKVRRGFALVFLLALLSGCGGVRGDGFSELSADSKPGKGNIPFELQEAANLVSVEMAESVTIDVRGALSVQPPTTDNGVTTQVTTVTGEDMDFQLVSITYDKLTDENLEAAYASLFAGYPDADTTRRSFSVKSSAGVEITGTELVVTSPERMSVNRLFRVGETNTLLLLTAVCEEAEQVEEARMVLDRVRVP